MAAGIKEKGQLASTGTGSEYDGAFIYFLTSEELFNF